MNDEVPDEMRFFHEGWRLVGNDVQAGLLARGWSVTDLDVADDEPLEFFWPPTAPVGYGGLAEWTAPEVLKRPQMFGPRQTPWMAPTRITRCPEGWRVRYGEAISQEPDPSTVHPTDKALLGDLPRIEWWPMSVEEAKELQEQRVLHTTWADAYDQHSLGYLIRTEPYEGRLLELRERVYTDTPVIVTDDAWKWAGDLKARTRIIDGEAWASAVRSARAGGHDWDTSGPKRSPDQA